MYSEHRRHIPVMLLVHVMTAIIIILDGAHIVVGILWMVTRGDSKFYYGNGLVALVAGICVLPELLFKTLSIRKKNFFLGVIGFILLVLSMLLDLGLTIAASRKIVQVHNQGKYRDEVIQQTYIESFLGNGASRRTVDVWQSQKKCCGYKGTSDPEVIKDSEAGLLMDSCCAKQSEPCKTADAFQDSCTIKIVRDLQYSASVLLPITSVCAFASILQLILFTPLVIEYYKIWKSSREDSR